MYKCNSGVLALTRPSYLKINVNILHTCAAYNGVFRRCKKSNKQRKFKKFKKFKQKNNVPKSVKGEQAMETKPVRT